MPDSFLRRALPFLVLLAIGALAFAPGLGGRFLFDDYANIVSNDRVHMETLSWASLRDAARGFEPGWYGRPLATLTFAFDHWIAATDPFQYKLTSLLVHLLNALLVFVLVRRLLDIAWPGGPRVAAALVIALAWTVHPIQVASTLYIVQRMETLSYTFVLLGLIAYLRGRTMQMRGEGGWPWLAGAGLIAAVGLLAKESAALFPVYALALELTVLGFAASRPADARVLRQACAIGAIVAVLVFVLVVVPTFADPARYASRDFSLGERLLSQLRVLPMYLHSMMIPLPDNLPFYYDQIEPSRGLFQPWTTAAGGALLLALAGVAVALRRRLPLFALGVSWFLGAHLITSNIVPLELAFEHRNYFALLGVLLAIAAIVHRLARPEPGLLAKVLPAVFVVALLGLCLIRSATWGNPFLLATDMAQRNPMSARAANDLGEQFMILADGNAASPFYQMAEREFSRGAALPRASVLPEQALILMAASAGQPAKQAWWDGFVGKLHDRPIAPQAQAAVFGLLKHRMKGMPIDDRQLARAYVEVAAKHRAKAPLLAMFADHAQTRVGAPDLAERLFVQAVDASRDDPEYMLQLAQVLTADGHTRHAQAVMDAAAKHGVRIR